MIGFLKKFTILLLKLESVHTCENRDWLRLQFDFAETSTRYLDSARDT